MPNHIKNRLTFTGKESDIAFLVEMLSTHYPSKHDTSFDGSLIYKHKETGEYGWYDESKNEFKRRDTGLTDFIPDGFEPHMTTPWTRFPDFEKVVPMPKGMDEEMNSGIEYMIKNALKIGLHENGLIAALEVENRKKTPSPLDLDDKGWIKFITGLNNMRNHGHINWYSWSIENWGTKWNSYEGEQISENVYQFETAWSGVPGLIEIISKKFPLVEILYEWSDEDTGSNCGFGTYLDGEKQLRKLENGSNEAYELSIKLRPDRAEWYEIINGKWQYKEEEPA